MNSAAARRNWTPPGGRRQTFTSSRTWSRWPRQSIAGGAAVAGDSGFRGGLLALLLTMGTRLRKREGQVFAAMMVAYPILRFFEEMIRADNPHDLTKLILTHNQYTSMVMLAIGIVMFVALRRLSPSCGPAWAQRTVTAPMGKGKIDLLLEGA